MERCWHNDVLAAPDYDWEIPSELNHRHEQCLHLHKGRNDGGGKRTNVQGRVMDSAEATKRSGLPSGTRWRVHVYGETWNAHGDVGSTTHIFIVLRQDLQTMETEPADLTAHDAGGTLSQGWKEKVDGSWGGFADDLFIKDVLPDHTADSAKDVILNNAESSTTRWQRIGTSKTFANWRSCRASVDMGSKDCSQHWWSRLERSWVEQGTPEADAPPSTVATKRKSSADYRRWRRTGRGLRGFWFARSPWSHRRLIFLSRIVSASITGLDAYSASPGGLNRIEQKVCRYLRALCKGKGI